jgi:hypothetical protein
MDNPKIIHVLYEPRFKHFKPPFRIKFLKWEISMMWAYKIHKVTMYGDIKPAPSGEEKADVKFSCIKYENDEINKKADELKTKWLEFLANSQKIN